MNIRRCMWIETAPISSKRIWIYETAQCFEVTTTCGNHPLFVRLLNIC